MKIEITEQKSNGVILRAQSQCGRYEWFFLKAGIYDTVAGRCIHQMAYIKPPGEGFGSDPLPDDVAEGVREFLAALRPLVESRHQAAEEARIDKEAAEIDKREALLDRMDSYMDPEDR